MVFSLQHLCVHHLAKTSTPLDDFIKGYCILPISTIAHYFTHLDPNEFRRTEQRLMLLSHDEMTFSWEPILQNAWSKHYNSLLWLHYNEQTFHEFYEYHITRTKDFRVLYWELRFRLGSYSEVENHAELLSLTHDLKLKVLKIHTGTSVIKIINDTAPEEFFSPLEELGLYGFHCEDTPGQIILALEWVAAKCPRLKKLSFSYCTLEFSWINQVLKERLCKGFPLISIELRDTTLLPFRTATKELEKTVELSTGIALLGNDSSLDLRLVLNAIRSTNTSTCTALETDEESSPGRIKYPSIKKLTLHCPLVLPVLAFSNLTELVVREMALENSSVRTIVYHIKEHHLRIRVLDLPLKVEGAFSILQCKAIQSTVEELRLRRIEGSIDSMDEVLSCFINASSSQLKCLLLDMSSLDIVGSNNLPAFSASLTGATNLTQLSLYVSGTSIGTAYIEIITSLITSGANMDFISFSECLEKHTVEIYKLLRDMNREDLLEEESKKRKKQSFKLRTMHWYSPEFGRYDELLTDLQSYMLVYKTQY